MREDGIQESGHGTISLVGPNLRLSPVQDAESSSIDSTDDEQSSGIVVHVGIIIQVHVQCPVYILVLYIV